MIRSVEIIMNNSEKIDERFKVIIRKNLEETFLEQDRIFDRWLDNLPQASIKEIDASFIGPNINDGTVFVSWNHRQISS